MKTTHSPSYIITVIIYSSKSFYYSCCDYNWSIGDSTTNITEQHHRDSVTKKTRDSESWYCCGCCCCPWRCGKRHHPALIGRWYSSVSHKWLRNEMTGVIPMLSTCARACFVRFSSAVTPQTNWFKVGLT